MGIKSHGIFQTAMRERRLVDDVVAVVVVAYWKIVTRSTRSSKYLAILRHESTNDVGGEGRGEGYLSTSLQSARERKRENDAWTINSRQKGALTLFSSSRREWRGDDKNNDRCFSSCY